MSDLSSSSFDYSSGASLVVREQDGSIDVDTRGVCLAAVEHVASHWSADSAIPSAVDRMASHGSELDRDVLDLQDQLDEV